MYSRAGARGLKASMEKLLSKAFFEYPDAEDCTAVYVDEAAVLGKSEVTCPTCMCFLYAFS